MRAAGFLLLLAGWIIVVCAVALLVSPRQRVGFVGAGLGVEALGLVLTFRSHLVLPPERR